MGDSPAPFSCLLPAPSHVYGACYHWRSSEFAGRLADGEHHRCSIDEYDVGREAMSQGIRWSGHRCGDLWLALCGRWSRISQVLNLPRTQGHGANPTGNTSNARPLTVTGLLAPGMGERLSVDWFRYGSRSRSRYGGGSRRSGMWVSVIQLRLSTPAAPATAARHSRDRTLS